MVFARQRSADRFCSSQASKTGVHHSARDFAARCDRLFRALTREQSLRFLPRRANAAWAPATHGGSANTRVAVEGSLSDNSPGSIACPARRTTPSPGTESCRYHSALPLVVRSARRLGRIYPHSLRQRLVHRYDGIADPWHSRQNRPAIFPREHQPSPRRLGGNAARLAVGGP